MKERFIVKRIYRDCRKRPKTVIDVEIRDGKLVKVGKR